MGTFSEDTKNEMLDSKTFDRVQLHDGDPGADGTGNVVAGTMKAAVFAAAGSGARALSADVEWTGLTPLQSITHFSVWEYNGGAPIFRGKDDITGDQAANAAGEYTLKGTTTTLTLTDPA